MVSEGRNLVMKLLCDNSNFVKLEGKSYSVSTVGEGFAVGAAFLFLNIEA